MTHLQYNQVTILDELKIKERAKDKRLIDLWKAQDKDDKSSRKKDEKKSIGVKPSRIKETSLSNNNKVYALGIQKKKSRPVS